MERIAPTAEIGELYSCRPGQAKREPGPITTNIHVALCWGYGPCHSRHQWLWVPAFAGTTTHVGHCEGPDELVVCTI